MRIIVSVIFSLAFQFDRTVSEFLNPPYFNLAAGKKVETSATCGENLDGTPMRELYCSLAGATAYSPRSGYYSYALQEPGRSDHEQYQELRIGGSGEDSDDPRIAENRRIEGGQNCLYCDASEPGFRHPSEFMVDGSARWWQSPPLSRGMGFNQINISIDLQQEFHVAYVSIVMANSPRPGSWVLERSTDHGKTWKPWQYFAENSAECVKLFGEESLQPIFDDEDVICSTEYSQIVPLENGQIFVTLVNNRPSRMNFSHSENLQRFTRATNVRIRLLQTKTLQGHLMDLAARKDPTITRRYFYSIKEIEMGGRCVCNGHAQTCDILDQLRPSTLLCRCVHNTCGDQCERCCEGFEQKEWQPSREGVVFKCERCNCFGHSQECQYDVDVAAEKKSLDIHGNFEGGGRCLNCRDNTQGINCNECKFGFYRPNGKFWNETDVCQPCVCDPYFHTGGCKEISGKCECKARFTKPDCGECAEGFYDHPECKPCDCSVKGTEDTNGTVTCVVPEGDIQCPCKEKFGGQFCEECAPGYYNFTDGCVECGCDDTGAMNQNCTQDSGQCVCRDGFGGLKCDQCADGYFKHPQCQYCNCDPSGTGEGTCDKDSGVCLCKDGYTGERCDKCNDTFYGYPDCKTCDCDITGSQSLVCNSVSGQCPCLTNFTDQQCNRCSAGYFNYPKCTGCNCIAPGSKGVTCDDSGICYCKDNFDGEKCEKCKENFYNYPVCEECNCNPNGVSSNFAGCDKVPPGELCTCKSRVTGRICDQCLPTYWNLHYHNVEGCDDCGCYLAGTVSRLNLCEQTTGQCSCKPNTNGRTCNQCAKGFYNLEPSNPFGCSACNCDVGGAMSEMCDVVSGQCRCRPRIRGKECTEPVDAHYYPDLWHNLYEAEDGRIEGNQPVRFAIDESKFANFSWKGYAVFSPVQDEIILDVQITRSNMFRVLFHYVNPTDQDIDMELNLLPVYTHTEEDVAQKKTFKLPPTTEPTTIVLEKNGAPHPFVLNPQRWDMKLKTQKRIFLDYVVMLPGAYYEANLLKQNVKEPCEASSYGQTTCLDMKFPVLTADSKATASNGVYLNISGVKQEIPTYSVEYELPPILKEKNLGEWKTGGGGNGSSSVSMEVTVQNPGKYVSIVEYFEPEMHEAIAIITHITDGATEDQGSVTIHNCPYSNACREVATEEGQVKVFYLDSYTATVTLSTAEPLERVGLASVTLVPESNWTPKLLIPKTHTVRQDGNVINEEYLTAPESTVIEMESGSNVNKSISGDTLPFPVANADELKVLTLDANQATIDVSSSVPAPGHYIFIVHYFNPESVDLDVDVLLQNDHLFETYLAVEFCPSVSGCRAVLKQKSDDMHQFWIKEKFVASFFVNKNRSDASIYLDSITAVPFHMYSPELLTPLPIWKDREFVEKCSANNFKADPETVSDYCKKQIFSLTTDFNTGAFDCGCSPQGSKSFMCEKFGGECECRENIIGRQCNRCKSGFYGFPICQPCNCRSSQQCHQDTGQCFCPLHVEGKDCDKCAIHAFGFDPLIGCQLCDCQPDGSEGGRMECDQNSGQCLCKLNVGGRKCDKCLSGHYGFPYCHRCSCESAGSTPEICDQRTAECVCKTNVGGQSCESCLSGTFNLEESNPKGCTDCFCFGTTSQCQSSYWKKTEIRSMTNWTTNYPNDTDITYPDDNTVKLTIADPSVDKEPYFSAPIEYLGKRLASHGGQLTYYVTVKPQNDQSAVRVSPEAKLIGGELTLEHWAEEQPADPKEKFPVIIDLIPTKWLQENGQPITRAQLMTVLLDLKALHIKAGYYDETAEAEISDVRLDSAENDGNPQPGQKMAASVEVCQCPPPYRGSSCEECAEGYYRVASGPFLGACVPCQCNGHSGKCDPDTGKCEDCMHNTLGDHCELCASGYYGNATRGSPFDCRLCPCPISTEENNFATACEVDVYGQAISCTCKEGYTGARCEVCDIGFFGEPEKAYGNCQSCFCNENNDLSIEGACDTITGICGLCQNDTSGVECELCAPWFHGDATEAKNCSACSCDQCGSRECDRYSGQCKCHPLVEGDDCNKCVENAWGFQNCQGCQMCNCAEASMATQCDENGQCPCQPGVEGQRCDRCKYGYWNYTAQGCKKCDCEADLSMGTVCDVTTGQCQCQEGATGPRCDKCIEGYLRVPEKGCLPCDECVHVLKFDLDLLVVQMDDINGTVANLSTDALTGARLNRINETLDALTKRADDIVNEEADLKRRKRDAEEEIEEGEEKNLIERGSAVLESAKKLEFQADRLNSLGSDTTERAEQLEQDGTKAVAEGKRVKSLAEKSIARLEELIGGFKDSAVAESRQKLLEEAEKLLEELRAQNLTETEEKATEELVLAEELLKQAENLTRRLEDQEKAIQSRDLRESDLDKLLTAYVDRLEETVMKAQESADMDYHLNRHANTIKEEGAAHGKVGDLCLESVRSGKEFFNKTQALLKDIMGIAENLPESIERFNDSARKAKEKTEGFEIGIPDLGDIPEKVQEKANELDNQKEALVNEFSGVKSSSEDAVQAASAYSDITENVGKAEEAAKNASLAADGANEQGTGKEDEAKEVKEASGNLARKASEVANRLVNNVTKTLTKQKESLKKLETETEQGEHQLKSFNDELKKLPTVPDMKAERETAAEAKELVSEINKFMDSFEPLLEELDKETKIGDKAEVKQNLKSATQQLNKTLEKLPEATSELNALQQAAANATAALNNVDDLIESLKKKIALARDTANRIKVGAEFAKGSSLRLENPPRITRSAAYTLISLHFKTSDDGFLLFFGNEVGSGGNRLLPTEDFLSVEIVQGRPKLIVSLGDKNVFPLQITNDQVVSDGKWHKLTVERTGKIASIEIATEGQEPTVANGTALGTKSVLNLHQEISKFYVGGVPPSARMPQAISSRHFVGAIEDIQFHGNPVGLWNFAEDGLVETYGTFKRKELITEITSPGIRLSGDGYVVMNRGIWDPRKNCSFRLSFKTYAPEGLLFNIGKEPDFMALELNEGHLSMKYNLGSGLGRLDTTNVYNDGKWHMVSIKRGRKEAVLEVDGDEFGETVKGSSPGDMFELGVTDVYYVGGMPAPQSNNAITSKGLSGCIDSLYLDSNLINLNDMPRAAMGVEPGCPDRPIRVVGFGGKNGAESTDGIATEPDRVPEIPGRIEFGERELGVETELTLRFKTQNEKGMLFFIGDEEGTNAMWLELVHGFLRLKSKANDEEVLSVQVELASASDGHWHFVTSSRTELSLRLDVDDQYSNSTQINSVQEIPTVNATLIFGSLPDTVTLPVISKPLIGCLGDVTVGGTFLDFAQSTFYTEEVDAVSLVGCAMESLVPTLTPPVGGGENTGGTRSVEPDKEGETSPTEPQPTSSRQNSGECALNKISLGVREDSAGSRFGLEEDSRMEFEQLPESFDQEGEFSIEFRATASSGLMMFAADPKLSDYVALYMKDKKIVFTYRSGDGPAFLRSQTSFVDGEWHTVVVKRVAKQGWLSVDGKEEATGESPGKSTSVNTQPPFYVGGLPPDVGALAFRAIEETKPSFGGCLRNMKLNGNSFGKPSGIHGVQPCSQYTEKGLYFGHNGGFAVLQEQLYVGPSFSVELDMKPRVKTGVILAISAGEADFLTLQLIEGVLKFTLDNGAGIVGVEHARNSPEALCDGHWHRVKIYKTKNLITMSVDGKSVLEFLKKKEAVATDTNDPLYLGGVPDGYQTRGLETTSPFVGCVRVVSLGNSKPRRKKNVKLDQVRIEGDVIKDSCPVN